MMLTKMEKELRINGQVRYTEELGSTLEELLSSDPWKDMGCVSPASPRTAPASNKVSHTS